MIVCINCSPDTKTKMDSLLGKDHYSDYSELIAVAVDNLLMLEKEVAEKGDLVIEGGAKTEGSTWNSPAREGHGIARNQKPVATQSRRSEASSVMAEYAIPAPVRIPELFLAEGLEQISVATVDIPRIERDSETFTLDEWIFGQYNKLLPAKVNCRALLRIGSGKTSTRTLAEVVEEIAEAAALLGDYLAEHDRRNRVGRDDAVATAFPRSGSDAAKSRARYANQFVGSVNSQGVFSGLLWDYRLAVVAPGEVFIAPDKRSRWDYRLAPCASPERTRLALTEPAVQFARLTNPVLDACQTGPAQKFSPEEVDFILEHIRNHVPVEAFAFRTLIHAIADGADTPDKLDEALRFLVPSQTGRSLSPSFLISQRSGALSRMADLGLIARERKGVRVAYKGTEQGKDFM